MNTPFITRQTLETMVDEEQLSRAAKAMDALSVYSFHYDRKGRIEAGIRPTASSGIPSSHAKIARRGSRYRPECLDHGRTWCVHCLILALHHIGEKPEFKVAKRPAQKKEPSKSQLNLVLETDGSDFNFYVWDTTRRIRVPNASRFLEHHRDVLRLSESFSNLILENGTADGTGIRVETTDLGAIFNARSRTKPETLYRTPTEAFVWNPRMPQPPICQVEIVANRLKWCWKGSLTPEKGDTWIPGQPGFSLRGNQITQFPYLTPLGPFYASPEGHCATHQSEFMARLSRARHQVEWLGKRPNLIGPDLPITLEFQPDQHDLNLTVGVEVQGKFFPLESTSKTVQVLSPSTFISTRPRQLSRLRDDLKKLGLPPETKHLLRGDRALQFLENASLPRAWQINRKSADDWFGKEQGPCECKWVDGKPTYQVQGEHWNHSELVDYLMPSGNGVRLQNGQILRFDTSELELNQEILESLERADVTDEQRRGIIRRVLDPSGEKSRPQVAVDPKWTSQLRPYQQLGLFWMLELKKDGLSGLLADDMGLGKTIQTLAFLSSCQSELPQLIVVPRTLLSNWKLEIERFTPQRKVVTHHGAGRTTIADNLQSSDLILTTYGTILRDADLLYDVHFDVVVLDEAQAIKNPESQTCRAIFELWSETRLALTGTPVENSLSELWSVFQFLMPDYLGSMEPFKGVLPQNSPLLQFAKRKLEPFMLRRMKNEVASDLPEKQELTIRLPLSKDQETVYQQLLDTSRSREEHSPKNRMSSLLTAILRLRQTCCHPGLIADTHLTKQSSKFNYLLDALVDIQREGHAALVFSQFTKLLDLLKFQLDEQAIPFLYLDGKTRNRQQLVDRFQEGEGSVFLISLKAGGTGLNLTRASYVFHLDPWWNPMVEAQATDRAHRIGQSKKVFSYKLITENTIEDGIVKLQERKKALASALWDEDGQTMPAGLTQKDLEWLLEL